MQTAIALTIVAYLLLLWAMSAIASHRAANADYFIGSRRTSWWVAAISMVSAAMSGVTFISVPGMVQTEQFTYLQMFIGFAIGYVVIAFVLVPIYYRNSSASIYGYFDDRFGGSVRSSVAWLFTVAKLIGAAIRLYVICHIMHLLLFSSLGIPFVVTAAVAVAYSAAYTFRGGVKSILWCDLLKTFAMVASIVWCIVIVASHDGMTFGEAWAWSWQSDYSQIWCFDATSPRYIVKQIVGGFFIVIATTGIDQDIMQRTVSCAKCSDAQKNMLTSIVLQTVVVVALLWLGSLMYLYAGKAGIEAAGDSLFATVATHSGMPILVAVLFTLGVTAATFSASGSALTALTTSATLDILGGASLEEGALRRLRHRTTIVLAVAMWLIISLVHILSTESVIDTVYRLASYTYGPILGLFLFGIFTRRGLRRGAAAVVGVTAPLLCVVMTQLSADIFGGYQFGYELLAINAAISFVGLWLLSTPRK